jgi:hypothetical protein
LDVNLVADEIVALIEAGTADCRLKWYGDSKVRIVVGQIIPEGSAVDQTLKGRRRRLRGTLEDRLKKIGWRKVGIYTFEKIGSQNKS